MKYSMNLFRNTSWYRPAFLILVTLLAGVFSCKRPSGTLVSINTELGEIVVEVYPDRAPVTSHNFLEHVEKGTYTNSLFYR
ncbi:MAG: hypothetical protein E4H10_08665, partial [Bacteroidia bacterium]